MIDDEVGGAIWGGRGGLWVNMLVGWIVILVTKLTLISGVLVDSNGHKFL